MLIFHFVYFYIPFHSQYKLLEEHVLHEVGNKTYLKKKKKTSLICKILWSEGPDLYLGRHGTFPV